MLRQSRCVRQDIIEDSECGSGQIDQIFMCLIHWRRAATRRLAYQTHGTFFFFFVKSFNCFRVSDPWDKDSSIIEPTGLILVIL